MRYEQECIPADHPIPNTRFTAKNIFLEPDFSRTCGFRRMLADTLFYQFQQLKVPTPWLDFLQNVKNLIFWHIFVIFGWFRIFDQKRALSVCSYYRYLTSCKKSERSHARFSRKSGNGLTNGLTDCNVLRTLLNVSFNLYLTLHSTLTHFSNKLHKTLNCSIMHLLKIGKKVKD